MVWNFCGCSLALVVVLVQVILSRCNYTIQKNKIPYDDDLATVKFVGVKSEDGDYKDYTNNNSTNLNGTLEKEYSQNETIYTNQTRSNRTINNCSVCATRQRDKEMRIEYIKHQILSKLHMTTLPNMTSGVIPKVPTLSFLLDKTLEMQADAPYRNEDYEEYHDDHDYYGRVDKVYTFGKIPPDDLHVNKENACYFEMPAEVHNVKIRMADLWFYVKPTIPQSTVIEMRIHRICPPSMKCGKHNMGRIFYRKHIPSYKKGKHWYRVDVRHLVHKWIHYPEYNYGLVLTAFDYDGKNLMVTPTADEESKTGYEPILEFETVEINKRRPKRSISLVCSGNTENNRCCRHPLEVDFVNFGWDWVIAPTRYKADYCTGECVGTFQDEHAHAYLRQQASPASGGPCCTPTQMQPLSLLYFDHDHNILYTDLQNMKVKTCGCA